MPGAKNKARCPSRLNPGKKIIIKMKTAATAMAPKITEEPLSAKKRPDPINNLVIKGKATLICENTIANLGSMNQANATPTINVSAKTKAGYIMAEYTFERRTRPLFCSAAITFKFSASFPEDSPSRTRAITCEGNNFVFSIACHSGKPASTSAATPATSFFMRRERTSAVIASSAAATGMPPEISMLAFSIKISRSCPSPIINSGDLTPGDLSPERAVV